MRLECKNIEACTDYYVALDVGKDWVKPKCLGSICKKCIHADKCKKDKSDNTTLTCEYKIMCFCTGWEGTQEDRAKWEK